MRRMRRRARKQRRQSREQAGARPPFGPAEEALFAFLAQLSRSELEALLTTLDENPEAEVLIPVMDSSLCGPDCPFHRGEPPTEPVVQQVGPNDPCICGSGRTLRACHGRGSDEGFTHVVMPLPPAA